MLVFEGSARDGARGFPANVNVAAALALAGIGPDRTRLEIWADPAVDAQHAYDRGRRRLRALHHDDRERAERRNPATGQITPLSVIAALRSLTAPLRVGT